MNQQNSDLKASDINTSTKRPVKTIKRSIKINLQIKEIENLIQIDNIQLKSILQMAAMRNLRM